MLVRNNPSSINSNNFVGNKFLHSENLSNTSNKKPIYSQSAVVEHEYNPSRELLLYRNINFCARPEYDRLASEFSVRASNYFRRGGCYGCASEEFKNVVDVIKLVCSNNKKPKILIAGIGEAQEPFSILAVIRDTHKRKPLESVVDLNCVDLQPKISDSDLDNYAYCDSLEPMFAKRSFDYVENPTYRSYYPYKVKPEIQDYLRGVFDDESRTKWDTKIEDFSAQCPAESYDMITFNNTLGYIEGKDKVLETMGNICRILKPNGILITDPYDQYREMFPVLSNFKKISDGIWQKPAK